MAAAIRSEIDRGAVSAGAGGDTGEVEGGRSLIERFGDAVPHALGGALTAVGSEEGSGLAVALHLGPATGAASQVPLDHIPLVVIDGVESEGT